MSSKPKRQVVGYRYNMGLHFGIDYGADELIGIDVGGREVWSGSITSNTTININKPELFGGDGKEGGIVGALDIEFGESTQGVNSYLAGLFGSVVPAFRGMFGAVWRGGQLAANNPYIKPWSWTRRRFPKGWYAATAIINTAHANPAHMIRECITNNEWGMGWPDTQIDDAIFTIAADALYAEGFGLSMEWKSQIPIGDFVGDILDHINAVLYTDQSTGLFTLKLVRDDYTIGDLPLFDENNIIQVDSYQRALYGETVNEITLIYTDPNTFLETPVTVQDLSNISIQGGIIPQTVKYAGIQDHTIARRVAMRDLNASATPLSKITITTNRDAWDLNVGEALRFSWANLGAVEVAYRILSIDKGDLGSDQIVIKAAEDVFGLPQSSYSAVEPIGWVDPSNLPEPITSAKIVEVPYYDLATQLSAADFDYIDHDLSFLYIYAARPTGDAYGYDIHSKVSTAPDYNDRGDGTFTGYAETVGDIDHNSGTVQYTNDVQVTEATTELYCYIEDEIVGIAAIDYETKTITLDRGVLDTAEVPHVAGSPIYFWIPLLGSDQIEHAPGEIVDTKLLTKTGRGTLAIADASNIAHTTKQRSILPYLPSNYKINTIFYPAEIKGDIAAAWAHRDRLLQTAGLITREEASIGQEPGVTYRATYYDEDGILFHEEAGITGEGFTYLHDDEAADGIGRYNGFLRVVLQAERDGLISWQVRDHTVKRIGYGLHYGERYGSI